MKNSKVCLCALALVLSLGMVGCGNKFVNPNTTDAISTTATVNTTPIPEVTPAVEAPRKELIVVSKLTIKPFLKDSDTISGTVTNNNNIGTDVDFTIIYTNTAGTPIANEVINVGHVGIGGTKSFTDMISTTTDKSKITYKTQINDFVSDGIGGWK